MINTPVRVEAYGQTVWSNIAVDDLRRTECLCRYCDRLKPGSPQNCQFAERLYAICKEGGIATLITRCETWTPNTGRTGGC